MRTEFDQEARWKVEKGFLNIEPTTGYTLQQRFDSSVKSYWSATQSQIYRELKSLREQGLVTVVRKPGQGKPDQLVYHLTDAGQRALDQWLREPVEPQQIRHPFLLKLSLSAGSDLEVICGLFKTYQGELTAIEADLRSRKDAGQIFDNARSGRERLLWRLILDNGTAWVQTELTWTANALESLKELSQEEENGKA